MNYKNYFTQNIFFLRNKFNLTRLEVYTDLKIPKKTYADIENGISTPTLNNIIKITKYYKINLNNLVFKKLK